MSAPARLAAFGVLLAAVFGVAFGVGAMVGPEPADDPPAHQMPADEMEHSP
jgi:hypothetical protein